MREESRSRDPSPSTSTPMSITRTSCIKSASVRIRPSRLSCRVRGAVAFLIEAAPALGEGGRPAAGLVHSERTERAEAVTHLIDGDGCYAVGRERGGDISPYVVLVASGA